MELKNKIVVITGGCRGFGFELSKIFVSEGSRVVICDKVCEIGEHSLKTDAYTCDVTNEEEVQKFIDTVIKKYGHIDILINNAGVWIPHKHIEEVEAAEARRIFEVNVIGTFLCTKVILPEFKKTGGTIINIISTSALGPRPTTAIYSASKFAVNGFTQALREEVKDYPIKVLSVFPGAMKTELFKEGVPDDFDTYMDTHMVAQTMIDNIKKENPETELVIRKS